MNNLKEVVKKMVEQEINEYEEYQEEQKKIKAEKIFIGAMALMLGIVIGGILETL